MLQFQNLMFLLHFSEMFVIAAVRNENGVYYLNGNVHVGTAEPQYMGQTFFEYRRPNYGMEYLSALGPLRETLTVEVGLIFFVPLDPRPGELLSSDCYL